MENFQAIFKLLDELIEEVDKISSHLRLKSDRVVEVQTGVQKARVGLAASGIVSGAAVVGAGIASFLTFGMLAPVAVAGAAGSVAAVTGLTSLATQGFGKLWEGKEIKELESTISSADELRQRLMHLLDEAFDNSNMTPDQRVLLDEMCELVCTNFDCNIGKAETEVSGADAVAAGVDAMAAGAAGAVHGASVAAGGFKTAAEGAKAVKKIVIITRGIHRVGRTVGQGAAIATNVAKPAVRSTVIVTTRVSNAGRMLGEGAAMVTKAAKIAASAGVAFGIIGVAIDIYQINDALSELSRKDMPAAIAKMRQLADEFEELVKQMKELRNRARTVLAS